MRETSCAAPFCLLVVRSWRMKLYAEPYSRYLLFFKALRGPAFIFDCNGAVLVASQISQVLPGTVHRRVELYGAVAAHKLLKILRTLQRTLGAS